MTLRILLIDDHTLFRSGLRLLLQRHSQFEVVAEAADGGEGLKLARRTSPDVILLDLNMPGLSGLDTLKLLVQEVPQAAVVVLTVSEEGDELAQALTSGARGYLLKSIDGAALADAIGRAAAGESVISPAMTTKLVERFRAPPARAPQAAPDHERLTPREREIVRHLAQGGSNKEIARHLDVAESTVKIHVQNILKKLGLASRVQVVVYAVEHGLG